MKQKRKKRSIDAVVGARAPPTLNIRQNQIARNARCAEHRLHLLRSEDSVPQWGVKVSTERLRCDMVLVNSDL